MLSEFDCWSCVLGSGGIDDGLLQQHLIIEYEIADDSTDEIVFMMICEILPGVAILYFLDIKALQKAADATRSAASTTNSKAGMKSMYDTGPSAASTASNADDDDDE